jgi:hypothetical protein
MGRNDTFEWFNILEYPYVLAAPSIGAARKFLLRRNKEWEERCRKVEKLLLDPNRELPPIELSRLTGLLSLNAVSLPDMQFADDILGMLLKNEDALNVAKAFLVTAKYRLLDVQWKRIGDPGILLMALPDGTPVLISGKHVLKILPKGVRKISKALAYLDGKEES